MLDPADLRGAKNRLTEEEQFNRIRRRAGERLMSVDDRMRLELELVEELVGGARRG